MLPKPINCFIGQLITLWFSDGRRMQLMDEFKFIDSDGFNWVVPKYAIVDGSSIPRFLWSLIGSPLVGKHRVASVIHDYYCVTKSEPHDKVHKMYRDACRCAGVGKFRSKLLYRGILLGGPKWKN